MYFKSFGSSFLWNFSTLIILFVLFIGSGKIRPCSFLYRQIIEFTVLSLIKNILAILEKEGGFGFTYKEPIATNLSLITFYFVTKSIRFLLFFSICFS